MVKAAQVMVNPGKESIFKLTPIAYCVRAMLTGSLLLSSWPMAHANPAVTSGIQIHGVLPTPINQEQVGSTHAVLNGTDVVGVTEKILTAAGVDTGSTYLITQNPGGGANVTYTMTITEGANTTAATALPWQSFDVGKGDTVVIQQPSETSIINNQVTPAAGDLAPSQIAGNLDANGSVYLINPNGVNIAAGANVDTHGLVVSTLTPTAEALQNGIAMEATLTGNAAFVGNGQNYQQNADGSFALDANGNKIPISINVNAGATITAENGRAIMMFAPNIVNSGTVTASGGQVIMAAATDKVYLQEAPTSGTASASNPSDVRGLLVEVQTGGSVQNALNASISANQGNVTLMGFAVNQQGNVSATTTINENGTIRLLAREGATATAVDTSAGIQYAITAGSTTRPQDSGDGLGTSATVTLGAQSTTNINPEVQYVAGAETTSVASQIQPQSRLEIMAANVEMLGNGQGAGGAQIYVPSGIVQITATENPASPLAAGTAKNNSGITIASGALIDVSGLSSTQSMASNVISVKLQSNQLADAPLQKTGILFGSTVLIDSRADNGAGSTLADVTTEIGAMPLTLAEKMDTGGSISLNSEGSVNIQAGSELNFSGGVINYSAGYIDTTYLQNAQGVYSISTANPLMTYDSYYTVSQYQQAYLQGANAGSLTINSNQVSLQGNLQGQAVSGIYQRQPGDVIGGTLIINERLSAAPGDWQDIEIIAPNAVHTVPVDAAAFQLDPNILAAGGIYQTTLETYGNITLADNTPLQLASGGGLTLSGGSIDIFSNIQGAGADVTFNTVVFSTNTLSASDGTLSPADGHVKINPGVSIDLQGLWVNDLQRGVIGNNSVLAINGGTFSVTAQGNADLSGATVDVSGGAWLAGGGALTDGAGGSISLIAAAPYIVPGNHNPGSNLTITGAQLDAYGLSHGGSLLLEANAIDIGGPSQMTDAQSQSLSLAGSFFSQGGFGKFSLIADVYGLTVADNTAITLQQTNLQLAADFKSIADAGNIQGFSANITLPDEQRAASALTLTVKHDLVVSNGDLDIGAGAVINADNLGSVTLNSDRSINFDGTITALGGKVAFNITQPPASVFNSSGTLDDPLYNPQQAITLGSQALIDVHGVAITQLNAYDNVIGTVANGGTVALTATRGYIAAQNGSLINLSGTSALLSEPVETTSGVSYVPQTMASNGGQLTLQAAEGLFFAGGLQANAGGSGALGGSLSVSLDASQRNEVLPGIEADPFPGNPRELVVMQDASAMIASALAQLGSTGGSLQNTNLDGMGYVSANQITQAGFSSVSLTAEAFSLASDQGVINPGLIAFQGDVTLNVLNALTLDAPQLAWLDPSAAGQVNLTAASVTIGNGMQNTLQAYIEHVAPSLNELLTSAQLQQTLLSQLAAPTSGPGSLTVNAQSIDLYGASTTNGFNTIKLTSRNEISFQGVALDLSYYDSQAQQGVFPALPDIFFGAFNTASTLTLTANQIYPTTLSQYYLLDSGGNITFSNQDFEAVAAQVYVGATAITLADIGVWAVGDIVTGAGLAANTAITNITANANQTFTVNLSAATTSPITAASLLTVTLQTPSPVLEAYGNLSVNAANIYQDGDLLAPFGTITLGMDSTTLANLNADGMAISATQNVSFGGNSLTSVNGYEYITVNGQQVPLDIPLGVTSAGVDWLYPILDNYLTITAPQKEISINAQNVLSTGNATINLSGGGDVMAYEFNRLRRL